MRRWLATGVIVGLGLGGYVYANGVPGSKPVSNTAVTANVFVVASGGSASCTRSSTKVTFANASGHICGDGNGNAGFAASAWDNACWAATAGDTVAVKAGVYSRSPQGDGALFDSNHDCSDGSGADVNPNAVDQGVSTGTTANWVTYVCADSPCKVGFDGSGAIGFYYGNLHVIVSGTFDFNDTVLVANQGGGNTPTNIQFVGPGPCTDTNVTGCMRVYSFDLAGPKNFLAKNIESGARIYCGKNDSNVPADMRCSSWSTLAYANQFSNNGTASAGCDANNTGNCGGMYGPGGQDPEGNLHDGAGAATNVRIQNYYDHDEQVGHGGSGSHSGCWITDNSLTSASNIVFDGLRCERISTQGPQNDKGGITYENSTFGPSTLPLDQTSPTGKWDSNAGSQEQLTFLCGPNILIRYNTFLAGGGGLQLSGTCTNVRVVGNLFLSGINAGCGLSGLTTDSNTFGNGVTTCGTNATNLAAGDPLKQSSSTTTGHSWSMVPLVNANLTGSPSVTTYADNGSDSGDLNLGHDANGVARANPTHAGAYN